MGERLTNEKGAKKVKISPANFLFGKINRKFDFFSPSSKKKKQHFLAFFDDANRRQKLKREIASSFLAFLPSELLSIP